MTWTRWRPRQRFLRRRPRRISQRRQRSRLDSSSTKTSPNLLSRYHAFNNISSLWPQLVDHAINFQHRIAGNADSKVLESLQVLCLQGLFTRPRHHPALHPHLDPFRDRQRYALGDEHGCKLCISSPENFVIKGLSL